MSRERGLRLAMIGTRGVPAAYGGFETAVEEIGSRLVERGNAVTVYCRGAEERLRSYKGMNLVHLPAARRKTLETLSHTALSSLHAVTHRRPDAAFVFNAANSPFVPLLRSRGIPVAVHVDGLEWMRSKWGRGGRAYYRAAESLSVRTASALIADAPGIADYYRHEFDADTELLAYGAPIIREPQTDRLAGLGLAAKEFHLVVARFERENHVLEIVEGYRASSARFPLVVVGSAPYAAAYTEEVRRAAGDDPRIMLVGGVWDPDLLDQLYAGALVYLHGHSVGGTNPSLLRAMGAAAFVGALDVVFNREVAGAEADYFRGPADVARIVDAAESSVFASISRGALLRERAESTYDWDDVAASYEALAQRLAAGEVPNAGPHRRRRGTWSPTGAPAAVLAPEATPVPPVSVPRKVRSHA